MQWLQVAIQTSQQYRCTHYGLLWFQDSVLGTQPEVLSLNGPYNSSHKPKKLKDDSFFCVVVMDFKMNSETTKHRDNTFEHFVNIGLSWHGALVFYSVQVNVEPDFYDMRQDTQCISTTSMRLIINKTLPVSY